MVTGVTVRPAEERDIPRVGEMLRQVCAVHAALRPDLFVNGARKYTDEQLQALLRDPARPILVAADGRDCAVGYVFCVLQEYGGAETPHRTLYIDDLCVDEARRGAHVGTALYEAALTLAKERGCYNVTLHVWEGNDPAAAFYRARGMRVMKTAMETVL